VSSIVLQQSASHAGHGVEPPVPRAARLGVDERGDSGKLNEKDVGDEAAVADTDAQDIQACLEGDDEAYARIVKRYERDIARQMHRFDRAPAACEELVQEVFVQAYFSLDRFRGDAPFLHWLRRIATRVGYHHWTRQSREARQVPLETWDGAAEPDGSIDPAAAGALLHELFARLPPKERLVLTLLHIEECGTEEIAERMGWTRAMVKMRAYRARKKIRDIAEREKLLEKIGWTS